MSVHDHKEREILTPLVSNYSPSFSLCLSLFRDCNRSNPDIPLSLSLWHQTDGWSYTPSLPIPFLPSSPSLPLPFPSPSSSSFFLQKGLTSYKLPSFLLHVLQFLKELVSSGKGMNEGSGYGRSPPGVNRLTTVRMMNGRKERERGGEVYSVRVDQKMDRWKTMKE